MSSLVKTENSDQSNGSDSDKAAIEIRGLTRWFRNTCAVDHLSFTVRAGEVFGFIGPNGAGKTTTMRILATLDVPTEGHAWVDGFSVVDDPDRVRRRLGFMPDSYGTYPNVSCEEYLDFFARAYGLRGEARREALLKTMDFTQLDRLAQKPVDGLSKGMRQRLALGRALIHDPGVLILDEPAAGLDPRARIELREMICALAARGKALLISSHILTELAEMCDRVAIIEQGRLLAVGTVDEILHHREPADGDDETHADRQRRPPGIRIQIQLVERMDECRHWLSERYELEASPVEFVPGRTSLVPRDRQTLEFAFDGDARTQHDLLKSLLDAGFPVCGFVVRTKSLEEAFLSVTKGLVQ